MNHRRVMELLNAALDLDESMRRDFLARECAGNPELRAEVESLLAEEEALEADFLGVPVALQMGDWVDSGAAVTAKPLAASDWVGPYRVLNELGRGGMGTVYLAEQREPIERRIALKVIHSFSGERGGADKSSRRFAAECRALARLKHPNIAAVYDAGVTDDGQAFVAMEWVEGSHITQWCDEHRLSIQERIELFLGVCAGVSHAHQKGLVHRDLKPSNVLVSEVDGKAVAKVIDFGIARSLDESENSGVVDLEGSAEELSLGPSMEQSRSMFMGSPIYMSPEAAKLDDRSDVDTRTDVYSLGVLLYELLVGSPPFEPVAMGLGALLQRVRTADSPSASVRWSDLESDRQEHLANLRRVRPRALENHLRGDLDAILGKAMARERDARYDAVADLALELRRHLEHRPVSAREPTLTYRLSRFMRRNLAAALAAAAVIGMLVVGVIAITREAQRANMEAQRARQALDEAEQVSEFLIGLFETVDPDRRADDPESVDELLAKAEATMDEELADQPLARARFLQTIGRIAMTRMDLDRAASLYEKALALREEHQAPEHMEIVRAVGSLGVIYRRQGREAEAEAALMRAVEIHESSDETDTGQLAATLTWLANLHYQQKRYEDAAAGHRRALEIRRQEVPLNPGAIGESLNNLSVALRALGRLAEAKPILLEAESYFVEALGPEHPLLASCWLNMAGIEEQLGNWDEAEHLLKKAGDHFDGIHGPYHSRTLLARRATGALWIRWHRLDEAVDHLGKLLESQLGEVDGNQLEIAQTQSTLGSALWLRGDLDAAERQVLDALDIYSELLGPDHYRAQSARLTLAMVSADRGQRAQAVVSLQSLMAAREEALGANHSGVATISTFLGRVLFEEGDLEAASEAFSRAMGIHKSIRKGSVSVGKELLWLGRVRIEQGQVEEASVLLRRSVTILQQLLPPGHPDLEMAQTEAERAQSLQGTSALARSG